MNRTTRRAPVTRATRRVPRRGGSTGGGGKGNNTWMWWVGGIGLSLIISLVIGLSNKSSDDKQVRKEMIEVIQTFSDYSENSQYYTQLIDRFHKEAFEAAYSMSGRRTSAKLDEKAYLIQISSRMAAKASSDGKASVAETLTIFNQFIRTQ
ncbi:MAG: hypothetical protein H0W78_13380 [Planctomycetes bacterium]|nr:hypothetical protein [Planctomycetota bacterium]